ncbi:hypothetical protein NIES37_64110 [Tolypothrix tenuis PCC 7101]|uniref:Secreted protein n=1 Tax=Tolypothrix tenuis PCC 7101 TaxID=231146 RepID=A0A1Z4N9I6_9CYAN|nr:hypothetical protein [Aulosira sp. FACHB-113]BAZ02399.1 hypothetical protein NIES37_64110 [Tolypothrix tenuis PCC 7101]BAZ73680.1 hypothetical protein NIES50_22460 [Aulosira laxa NIES-50]
MKKYCYTASILLLFSLLTIPSVSAKPKLEQTNANVSTDNTNLPVNNIRSNAGGRLRGRERAAYVHCLNAAKKNREHTASINCAQNQVYRQRRSNIQKPNQNISPVNVVPSPQAEQKQ